jgi:hypothetical protein
MKAKQAFLAIMIVFTALSACRELPIGPLEGDCSDLPPPDNAWGMYDIHYLKNLTETPCYNPNNRKQFAWFQRDSISRNSKIFVFDTDSGENRLLFDQALSPPAWSTTGWIIATRLDGQLWKIKENGDSLTRIDNGALEARPSWSPDGSQMVVTRYPSGSADVNLILDKEGNFLDSVPRGEFVPLCWSDEDRIFGEIFLGPIPGVGYSTRNIGYYEISTRTLVPIYEIGDYFDDDAGRVTKVDASPSGMLYWTNKKGLYRTRISDGQTTPLLFNCDTRQRLWVSCSPDGKTILTDLLLAERISGDELEANSFLVEHDTNGFQQQVFDF